MREVCACPFLRKPIKTKELYAHARLFITIDTTSITGYQKMITRNTISRLSFGSLFSGPVFFTAACGSICGPSVCLEYARCMRGVCAACKDHSIHSCPTPERRSGALTSQLRILPQVNIKKKYYAPLLSGCFG